jgi:hypothetical protein
MRSVWLLVLGGVVLFTLLLIGLLLPVVQSSRSRVQSDLYPGVADRVSAVVFGEDGYSGPSSVSGSAYVDSPFGGDIHHRNHGRQDEGSQHGNDLHNGNDAPMPGKRDEPPVTV